MEIKCDKCKKIIGISNFDFPKYPKYVYRILCVGCGFDVVLNRVDKLNTQESKDG